MITHSGILILPTNDAAPEISDIAISLSRMPRFGGHTRIRWTVAQHSMVCAQIVRIRTKRKCSLLELYAMLHDAHECVTCDVPSTWKTKQVKEQQAEIDRRIYHHFLLPRPRDQESAHIRIIDQEALLAEGAVLGPPGFMDWAGNKRAHKDYMEVVHGLAFTYERNPDELAAKFEEQLKFLVDLWRFRE